MSFHLLHISEYGCKLSKDRGFLVCNKDDIQVGKMPIEDIRALILISESVAYSASIVAELLENDAVILHCKKFKPVGITLPLTRVYDLRSTLNQGASPKVLNREIWKKLLHAKISNSAYVLNKMGSSSPLLDRYAKSSVDIDEARCAKAYWKIYFPIIGEYGISRRNNNDSKANVMLNYGYGILGALIHRSIIVHGLSPLFGVYHKTYYKNTPLVYDLIEPYRAIVDFLLYKYLLESSIPSIRNWAKYLGNMLKEFRVKHKNISLKLMDSIEVMTESVANCYKEKNSKNLWVPYLGEQDGKYKQKKSIQNGLGNGNV